MKQEWGAFPYKAEYVGSQAYLDVFTLILDHTVRRVVHNPGFNPAAAVHLHTVRINHQHT